MSTAAHPAPAMESARVRLARLAERAAWRTPGVAALAGGDPWFTTPSLAGPVEGVACVAGAGGRYDLTIRITASPVPLAALADRIRANTRAAAARVGLEELVGSVDVVVAGLVEEPS